MKIIRSLMTALAVIHLLFAAVAALVGLFADGALWERIPIVIVHPVAAVVLLVVVIGPRPVSRRLKNLALMILPAGIAVDVILAALIAAGAVQGDWYLPLLFSIVPAAGAAYIWTLRTG